MGSHLIPAMHHWVLANIGRQNSWLLQFALTTLVLAWPGRHFFSKGFMALRRAPEMNSLVALAPAPPGAIPWWPPSRRSGCPRRPATSISRQPPSSSR